MSSGSCGNNSMNNNHDIVNNSDDKDAITDVSARLLTENAYLRKLMGLMQENMELRITLKDHESKARSLSPQGQQRKDSKDIKDKKQSEGLQYPNNKDEKQKLDSCRPRDPEKVKQCQQIVGELAFQLDRSILSAIFLEQQRLYGYQVANIEEKILQVTTCPLTSKVDDTLTSELNLRYHHTMKKLKKLGYDPAVHPYFTEYLVNTYGIMKDRTTGTEDLSSFNDPQFLGNMISEYMPRDSVEDILVILKCLAYLAKKDGKCLFIW